MLYKKAAHPPIIPGRGDHCGAAYVWEDGVVSHYPNKVRIV